MNQRCKRGPDLSSVIVGFSLTVANGLVPLQKRRMRKGEREINVRRRKQRQSGENFYKKMLWLKIMSLSLTVEVIGREMHFNKHHLTNCSLEVRTIAIVPKWP